MAEARGPIDFGQSFFNSFGQALGNGLSTFLDQAPQLGIDALRQSLGVDQSPEETAADNREVGNIARYAAEFQSYLDSAARAADRNRNLILFGGLGLVLVLFLFNAWRK